MRKTELEEKVAQALQKQKEQKKELDNVKKLYEYCAAELEKLINNFPTDKFPFTVGYEWRRKVDGSIFDWELVKVENAKGTKENPIEFESGMKCHISAYYKYNNKIYICLFSGTYEDIEKNIAFYELKGDM